MGFNKQVFKGVCDDESDCDAEDEEYILEDESNAKYDDGCETPSDFYDDDSDSEEDDSDSDEYDCDEDGLDDEENSDKIDHDLYAEGPYPDEDSETSEEENS
jgi:hypothetical protein